MSIASFHAIAVTLFAATFALGGLSSKVALAQLEAPLGALETRQQGEVADWNTFAIDLVAVNQPPPIQTHTLALVHIAIHDALNAIDARYETYAYHAAAPGGSYAAAIATAARDTLTRLIPEAAATIEARFATKLARLPEGSSKETGIAAGRAAAAAILALRGGDDLFGALGKRYTPGRPERGVYQLTPPLNFVVLAGWGELAAFVPHSATQFLSGAPNAVSSRKYARDYEEVRMLGALASTQRSAEQTETARFWFDVATKEWHRAAQQGLAGAPADEWQTARTLALLSIAMADTVIASARTKFHYNYWRPITAIRAGDADGNVATRGEATWEPLCVTPPFPEYNSTHAATGAAAARILALTIGDRHTFAIDSSTLPGVSRTYRRFSAAAEEEGVSRIYCGIHFRDAMNAGFAQGRRIARHVFANVLRPLYRCAGATPAPARSVRP